MKQAKEVESGILQFAILMGIQMGVRLENAGILNNADLNAHHEEVDIALLDAMKYVIEHSGNWEENDIENSSTKFARDVHLTMHIEESTERFRKIIEDMMNKKTICPKCNALVPKGNYCEVCGNKLKTEDKQ